MPVNGSAKDSLAINDRGLAYGDGLFETIRLHDGRPLLLQRHLDRLQAGAQRLQIALDRSSLDADIAALRPDFPAAGILKILVTRGSGGRGYRPAGDHEPTRILTLHPLPDYGAPAPEAGIAVFVCRQRLALQPALAGMKHLNRLEQVLASLEWPGDDFREGLMLDTDGNVIEGTRSNLFWSEGGRLLTPSLARCGVAGILRGYLLDTLPDVEVVEESPLTRILRAEQLFVCNSVFGIWPVTQVANAGQVTAIGGSPGTGPDYPAMAANLFRERLLAHADD